MANFICPQCGSAIDTNSKESEHQVNDLFDLTFCSYECSKVYTYQHITQLKDLTPEEIQEGI
ncbi:hypothetical protein AVT44_gp01 [Acinetobacter phage Fri1]|uniref:Uncharacterized protein n=1 Tax=Acinetobacter phage Fri1 TaxID=1647373 RepID=A0A0H4U023_9CAUD|nr:hypothetical protein AVT44_gp01 [Acinetobacter phage Fri1]AKQ06806.1 hypothetical protein Fri1_1 [Acinetobacter phage Fri1]